MQLHVRVSTLISYFLQVKHRPAKIQTICILHNVCFGDKVGDCHVIALVTL